MGSCLLQACAAAAGQSSSDAKTPQLAEQHSHHPAPLPTPPPTLNPHTHISPPPFTTPPPPGVTSFKDTNKVLALSRIMVAWLPVGMAMGAYDMTARWVVWGVEGVGVQGWFSGASISQLGWVLWSYGTITGEL